MEPSPSHPPPAAVALARAGYLVVMPTLCGFMAGGEPGKSSDSPSLEGNDSVGTGGFFPANGTYNGGAMMRSEAAENLAHELGRSIVGVHAGDVVRAHRWVREREDVAGIAMVVAEDFIDVAVMHALLAEAGAEAEARSTVGGSGIGSAGASENAPSLTPKLLLVRSSASHAAAALARIYSPLSYFSWVPGMLRTYDVADCIASLASGLAGAGSTTSVLVAGPVDELLMPLSPANATAAYAFAASVAGGGGGGKQLCVLPGNFSTLDEAGVSARALQWLAGGDGDGGMPLPCV